MKLDSKYIAELSAKALYDKKGKEIVILDLQNLTSITDYFVICTSDIDLHSRALSDSVKMTLKAEDERPWHIEGYGGGAWVLLDYVNVVVHIFTPSTRNYYNLEKLWGDAPRLIMQENGEFVSESLLIES